MPNAAVVGDAHWQDVAASCPTDPNVEHLPFCDACVKRLVKGINEPQIVAPSKYPIRELHAGGFVSRPIGWVFVARRYQNENRGFFSQSSDRDWRSMCTL